MKNTIIFCLLFFSGTLFSPTHAAAKTDSLRLYSTEIVKSGENVEVTFQTEIGKKAAPRRYSLVLIPEITDGEYSWGLDPMIVQAKRARVAEDRHRMATGAGGEEQTAFYVKPDTDFHYSFRIPYQEWMEGSSLVVGKYLVGCCSIEKQGEYILASNLELAPKPVVVEEPVIVVLPEPEPEPVPTAGERLAERYPFIRPASDMGEFGDLTPEARKNALIVYFRQNVSEIQMDYMNNEESLRILLESVREIEQSGDSRIKQVLIAGFASPEGTTTINTTLAGRRAKAVQDFTCVKTGLSPEAVVVYNGGVDWQGLRMLVEASDLPEKEQILEIIGDQPDDQSLNTRKLQALQRLGSAYRYMYDRFFPDLRNAAYIRVYYENE